MRLTNTIRDAIISAMSRHYYPTTYRDQLKEKIEELAVRKATASVPVEVLSLSKKYPGFFSFVSGVRFADRDKPSQWYEGGAISVYIKEGIPCADGFHALPFDQEIFDINKEIDEYEEKESALRKKIKQVVYACSTTKQLIETLPEAADFIPADKVAGLPVPIEAYQALRADLARLKAKATEKGPV